MLELLGRQPRTLITGWKPWRLGDADPDFDDSERLANQMGLTDPALIARYRTGLPQHPDADYEHMIRALGYVWDCQYDHAANVTGYRCAICGRQHSVR